ILNPAGTLSLANGNLSAAAGMGGGATGASLAAASLPAGRPIRGEPGGSGAPAGAGAAGALAGCAAAPTVKTLTTAAASNTLRGVQQMVMKSSPRYESFTSAGKHLARAGGFLATLSYISPLIGNRKCQGGWPSVSCGGRVREVEDRF